MKISLIVPVYNMGSHLEALGQSLEESGLLQYIDEILVVDDGSTDDTPAILNSLCFTHSDWSKELRVLTLSSNRGRFYARFEGAQAALGELLFFVDARTVFPAGAGGQLQACLKQSLFINVVPRIDVTRNIYSLYWQRSHEALFSGHYEALAHGPLWLTPENYDQFLKGTGGLIVPKDEFISICKRYLNSDIQSDDTLIMKDLVGIRPLLINKNFYYEWQPRDRFLPFLFRLIERGPGLIEYHVLKRRGWIFWSVMMGLLIQFSWLLWLAVDPAAALWALMALVFLVGTTVVFFAQGLRETVRLALLHLAVVFSFGLGVWYGLVYHLLRFGKESS